MNVYLQSCHPLCHDSAKGTRVHELLKESLCAPGYAEFLIRPNPSQVLRIYLNVEVPGITKTRD